jgi:hypothetical protein
VNRARHRSHLPTLLVFSLAIAVVGFHGRAQAQDDDDDDKLPAPVTHHVVHGRGSEAPDDDSPKLDETPDAEPNADRPAPRAKPAARPEPGPAAHGDDFGPEAAPLVPPPKKHHKETKREKRERLRQEKLAKKRQKAHHGAAAAAQQQERSPAEPRPEPTEPRVIHAAPRESGIGDEDTEPATVEHVAPTRRSEPTPAHEAGEGEARRPSGGDMDFELLPQKPQSSTEQASIESKIKTRRAMLQWHQGFGIATAALMAGTVITGQLNYSDRFGGGGSSGQYEGWHDTLEAATVVSFATAGLLAILTPTPFEHKSDGVDTVTVHKWTMLVATIGMGAEVPLGIWTVTREGYVNQGTLALTHLIVGYVTAAALTAGATALFF